MAQSSIGFAGTVDAVQWATLSRFLGSEYGVGALASLAVTQVAAARSVSVATGTAFGRGVLTTLDAAETLALPAPVDGQWHLIVLRRVWATKATSLVAIPHSITTTAVPTVPPATYPAAMLATPGIQDDQPLAWAWVRSTDTTVTIFDLRKLPVETRLAAIADTGWITVPLGSGWSVYGAEPPKYRRINGVVYFAGRAASTGASSTAAILPAGFRPATIFYCIAENVGASVRSLVSSDGSVGPVSNTAYTAYSFASLPPFVVG